MLFCCPWILLGWVQTVRGSLGQSPNMLMYVAHQLQGSHLPWPIYSSLAGHGNWVRHFPFHPSPQQMGNPKGLQSLYQFCRSPTEWTWLLTSSRVGRMHYVLSGNTQNMGAQTCPSLNLCAGPYWGQSMAVVAGWSGGGCEGAGDPRGQEWRAENPSEKGREAVGGGTTHEFQTPITGSVVPLDITCKTQIQRRNYWELHDGDHRALTRRCGALLSEVSCATAQVTCY